MTPQFRWGRNVAVGSERRHIGVVAAAENAVICAMICVTSCNAASDAAGVDERGGFLGSGSYQGTGDLDLNFRAR